MINDNEYNLTEMVPEFPNKPKKEISRDPFIRWITNEFGPSCQKQIIACSRLSGKTNFLAQFALDHENQVVSYFINSNPVTQDLRTFLFVICNQISRLLNKSNLPENITIGELKSLFPGLAINLADQAKKRHITYYFVIDGLEWGLLGEKGSRIIDYPLISFSHSPYILCSCNLDKKEFLQLDGYEIRDDVDHFLEFNLNDTRDYLSEFNLPPEDLKAIHQKAKGLPGYVKIIRDTIQTSGKEWIKANNLPDSLETLIRSQLKIIHENSSSTIHQAIELVAISPKPINLSILANMLSVEEKTLLADLAKTGIVFHDRKLESLQISPEFTREVLISQLGLKKKQIAETLLQYIQTKTDRDELLVTLLMREAKDMEGISEQLDSNKIITAFRKTQDISLSTKQFQIASQMAYESKNIQDLIKWNLGIKTTQVFLSHNLNFSEISALIAVGDSQSALRRAYGLQDSISKIRLLARAYSAMKEIKERVPTSAIEELRLLIESQNLRELDKEQIQDLAIDLFPVLPDKSIDLLENKYRQDENQKTILDIAVAAVKTKTDDALSDRHLFDITYPDAQYFSGLNSEWLKQVKIEELKEDTQELKSTKTKEYFIRQWCYQNKENSELHLGMQLWIDTVVGDNTFSIALRSLRKISDLLKFVKLDECEKLIKRLEIPSFNSLRTPWEEWIGFHLNIAEAISSHSPKLSRERIEKIYETINIDIVDLDVKIFCYARLWATVSKYNPDLNLEVKLNFERVLSSLLTNSALHDEILNKSLRIIAPIDIDYAIEKALEMNTASRRQSAIREIIKTSLTKNPNSDIYKHIQNVLQFFDERERSLFITSITLEIWRRNIKLSEGNQATLLKYSRKITDHSLRAEAILNLSTIWTNEKLIRAEKLINEAIISWAQEDDLKSRISLGYKLVERIAAKNKDAGRAFCSKVQDLYILPGAALAGGDLGKIYASAIEAAIQSLTLQEIISNRKTLESIVDLIARISAPLIRIGLYGQLAARSFTVGYPKEADEIIRSKLLPEIDKVEVLTDKHLAIRYCLPVIFRYHKQTAYELSKDLPDSIKSNSWSRTVIWILTLGYLQDDINLDHLKVLSDYPTLKEYAIEAAQNISRDRDLLISIMAICKTIVQSIKLHKVDVTQAYTLLQVLDELSKEKLPDMNNIKHDGYLIASLATINGARSIVYKSVNQKRNLSKVDIRKKWDELEKAARGIPNMADRVFVMQIVAKELFEYNDERASNLLKDADKLIDQIPAIIDRSDRLEEIGKAWAALGRKDLATYTMEKASKLISQMNDLSQDKKLEILVQSAYEFNPTFADELVTRYGSRFQNDVLNPVAISAETQKLINNPERILKGYAADKDDAVLCLIMRSVASRLYDDLLWGHGRVPPDNILLEWVKRASQYDTGTFFETIKWVQECINSQSINQPKVELSSVFVKLAAFTFQLATLISLTSHDGISEEIIDILPGLSSKFVVFRAGEFEKAKNWVKDWLKKYAEGYIKIVDPYFGPDQLMFFADIPKNCKMLIVTTNEHFKEFTSQERIQAQIEHIWDQYGKGKIPSMSLIIVPKSQEELFHDRVIISKNRGLDLGQSLNGLGNQIGKITDLPSEDAKELEIKYVDEMLNHNSWFINHDVKPMIFRVGD